MAPALEPDRVRRRGLVALVAAGALTAVMSSPSLRGWFMGDDLERMWRAVHPDNAVSGLDYPSIHWRPAEDLTYRLTYELGGLDPVWYLLSNLALHVGVAVMVGVLAVQLPRSWAGRVSPGSEPPPVRRWSRREWWTAMVATAWFGVVPSHGEAVANIAGRGDLLMTWWVLVALALHLRRLRTPGQPLQAGPDRRERWLLPASLAAFTAALLCKESAVALVGLVAIVGVARGRGDGPARRVRRALREAAPFALVTVVWFAARTAAIDTVTGGFDDTLTGTGPMQLGRHAAALVVRTVLPGVGALRLAALVPVAAVVVAVLVLFARRRPDGSQAVRSAAWAGACGLVSLAPGVVLGVAADGPLGERLTYLASVFAVIAVAVLLGCVQGGWPFVATVAAIAVTAIGGAGFVREQERWVKAGSDAEEIVAALGRLPADQPALILYLPDSADGATVMRNSVGAALAWFHGWTDATPVWQAAASESPDGTPHVLLEASSAADQERWRLTLAQGEVDGGAEWVQLFPRDGTRPLTVELQGDRRTVEITRFPPDPRPTGDGVADESVWWWQDGRLERVDDTRPR